MRRLSKQVANHTVDIRNGSYSPVCTCLTGFEGRRKPVYAKKNNKMITQEIIFKIRFVTGYVLCLRQVTK